MEQKAEQEYQERYEAFLDEFPDYPVADSLESINLITNKSNAINILKGIKRIELRDSSSFYKIQLLNKDVEGFISLKSKENPDFIKTYGEFISSIAVVDKIHFYDYYKSWYLDVSVKYNFLIKLNDTTKEWIHEKFDYVEMDPIFDSFENQIKNGSLTEDSRPLYFAFILDEVIDTNLTI